MNIVSIHCNPKPVEQSACRSVADRLVCRMQDLYPSSCVIHHDLYLEDIPEINPVCYKERAVLLREEDAQDETAKKTIRHIRTLVQEISDCDRLIISAPMWNLGIPGRLKNYLDCIVLQGETVNIRDSGIRGLMGDRDRRAVFVQSSGGNFGHAPLRLLNLGWHQVRAILSAIGFSHVKLLAVDGCGSTHESWEKAVFKGMLRIDDCLQEL